MKLFAAMALGALCFAQVRVEPFGMSRLKMLTGEWSLTGKDGKRVPGVDIEFQYNSQGLVERVRLGRTWQRVMLIHSVGEEVLADYFEANGRVEHYRLEDGKGPILRFTEDPPSADRREIVYEQQVPEHISYRFLRDGKVVDSGVLAMTTELRPLTD